MPFFPGKFTRKLTSTIDLIQGIQTSPKDSSGLPIQYVTGAFSPMYRERKPSAASQFINTAASKVAANPGVEKSRELFKKLSKKHPPHEVRSMVKESIVVIRNPENDELPPICEVGDFGSKGLTRYQLEAADDEFVDEDIYYRRKVESPLPPVPLSENPYGQNHRTHWAVTSMTSIRSQDSSCESSNGDTPPLGTPRDSFAQDHQIFEAQDTHYTRSGTPSSTNVHTSKSTPLLNRSLQRRVALNTALVRPLDGALLEASQPDYPYHHRPHYIKRSEISRLKERDQMSIDSGLDGDVESRLNKPLSWDSDVHSLDFQIQSPMEGSYGERIRDSFGTTESQDWHAEVASVNGPRLSCVKPLMVPAPRVHIAPSTGTWNLSSPLPSEPVYSPTREGSFQERYNILAPEKPTFNLTQPLRPAHTQVSLRLRARRPPPTRPSEIPPVPPILPAFGKCPQVANEESETDSCLTDPVPQQRRISWGVKDVPSSKFISPSSLSTTGRTDSGPNFHTFGTLTDRQTTAPLSIQKKTLSNRRRVSRALPDLPPAAYRGETSSLTESLDRMRPSKSTTTLARSNSVHGTHGASKTFYSSNGKYNFRRPNTAGHPALHHQRPLSCGLCQTLISPSTPSICSLKCHNCSSYLCAECFEALSTVDQYSDESGSDYSEDEFESRSGTFIYPGAKSRRQLARRSKELQMAQCADCLRCWCTSCSRGDPWRFFKNVVTEIRDDSSEMTTALGEDDLGLFVKQKMVCPACYETNMVEEGPTEDSS